MRAIARVSLVLAACAPLFFGGAGCGDSTSSESNAPDSGPADAFAPPPGDDGADVGPPGDAADAATDGADASDGSTQPSVALLTAYDSTGPAYGLSYSGGAWTMPAQFATTTTVFGGGGLVTAGGKGYAFIAPAPSSPPQTTTWNGSWPSATALGMSNSGFIGAPHATATHVFVAFAKSGPGAAVLLDAYDVGAGSWSLDEATGFGNNSSRPAVATTAAGDPLVIGTNSPGYAWTKRTGTTWSASAAVLSLTISGESPGQAMPTALVKRVGADDVFGFFPTGSYPTATLTTVTFSAGAWSTTSTPLGTDFFVGGQGQRISACALPDGRAAVAYLAGSVNIAMFDGTWGGATAVPNVSLSNAGAFAVAPGVSGATLELVYVDGSGKIQHTRLKGGSWSTPALVDGARTYNQLALATF